MSTTYQLPQPDAYREWSGYKATGFTPSERQQSVMDAVATALAEGLFYTKDVHARCVEILQPAADLIAVNARRNEGGEFGMDCFYARGALDAQREHATRAAAAAHLALTPGADLGALIFNDGKLIRSCTAESIDGGTVSMRGKRGASTVAGPVDVLALARAMDRAHESGKRKTGSGFQGTAEQESARRFLQETEGAGLCRALIDGARHSPHSTMEILHPRHRGNTTPAAPALFGDHTMNTTQRLAELRALREAREQTAGPESASDPVIDWYANAYPEDAAEERALERASDSCSITYDGDPGLKIHFDPRERSSLVTYSYDDGISIERGATPFQTADMPRDEQAAAKMVSYWLDAQAG